MRIIFLLSLFVFSKNGFAEDINDVIQYFNQDFGRHTQSDSYGESKKKKLSNPGGIKNISPDKKLFENKYFTIQVSENVETSYDSFDNNNVEMTYLDNRDCPDVYIQLIHIAYNYKDENIVMTFEDIKNMGMKDRLQNGDMRVIKEEVVKLNNLKTLKYTIESSEDAEYPNFMYLYMWPNKSQLFQLNVSGKNYSYLDSCLENHHFTNTLILK